MRSSWNSISLEVAYEILGWIASLSWVTCSYPQLILNFRHKSVVGLNFDYVLLNWTKMTCYLVYNATLYFSPVVQKQYHEKYGENEMIPVAANDVAFSTHAVVLYAFMLFQIYIYDRGNQKFSKIGLIIVSAAWFAAAISVIAALPSHSWLWLISVLSIIQVILTLIKYIPQAYMNFSRKSTRGFSIGFVLLDFVGGTTNVGQMAVQSIDQHSWVNFQGNIGKIGICMICIGYDMLLMYQHYVLYRAKKGDDVRLGPDTESEDSPLKAHDEAQIEACLKQ